MKALFVLSIVAPIGLLATFRLTNLSPQQRLYPQTVTAQEVVWNISRPTIETDIAEEVVNSYSDNIAIVSFNVFVVEYETSYLLGWSPDSHGLVLILTGTANVSEGFIHSIIIRFSKLDSDSDVDIADDPDAIVTNNVELGRVFDWQPDSYVEGYGVSQPGYCKLMINSRWAFFDNERISEHHVSINLEVTYSDGTGYQRVIVPVVFGVLVL
jgi:hypothetical protein